MKRSFDWFGRFETPQLVLCNPSGKELYVMPTAKQIKMTLRFVGYSELEFVVDKLPLEIEVPYYSLLESMREIKIDNYGTFIIDTVDEKSDSATWQKTVKCKSRSAIFATKYLVGFKGTKRLYSPYTTDTILGKILSLFPDWTIGSVDSDLWEEYRTYDVSEQNCYDFLMNDIQEDFNCVFKFDTINKVISVDCVKHAITKTDIYVSFSNLLKDITINQSEGVTTALEVYGGDGLNINSVNPLGTSVIYNFSHYKNTKWISQSTIDKLTAWENRVESQQVPYANLLTQHKEKNTQLITFKTELYDLQQKEKSINDIISTRISDNQSYSDLNKQLTDIRNKIISKATQISNKESELKLINASMKSINYDLSFENNFSGDELIEIASITKQSVYQNDCYVKTSIMSDVEIQEQSQKLYDMGSIVLNRLSQPRYTFSGEIINFLALKEFDVFSEQLQLGCEMCVSIDDVNCFYPILLEYTLDFDNIEESFFTFCNDLRPSNGEFEYASIFEGFQSSISDISYSKGMWEDYITSGDKDSFDEFKNNALDLSKKEIVSNDGQDFKISSYGIRGKKLGNTNEIWITNNCIAFSRDNFSTASLALGEATINGVKSFGLIADHIVGNFIAGKSLLIKNSNNTVTIDGEGFTATNANITLLRKDGASGVYLNPTDGIKIKSKINNVLQDVFYVDVSGNLNFKGNLTGATGTFSGTINGASFVGGSININNKFTVNSIGECVASSLTATKATFNSCNLKDSSFEAGSIKGSSINIGDGNFTVNSSGYVYGNNMKIAGDSTFTGNMTGGSIDIKTDVNVGNEIFLNESTENRLTGINFGNYSKIRNNNGQLIVETDYFYVDSSNIQLGNYSVSEFATKTWCNNNFATTSYVDDAIPSKFVTNVVWNESSRLLKVFFSDGDYENYEIADKIGEK